MTLYQIITLIHAIGAAIGVGAATASDTVFMASIRNRRITHDQFLLIVRSSHVVLGGLSLLVITGIILLLLNPDLWGMAHFMAKMTVVILLMINGLVFHARVIPMLKGYLHTTMPKHIIAARQWLLAITGATSVVCWFSALIIALLGPLGFTYQAYMIVIVLLIIAGSVAAHLLLEHIVFRMDSTEPESRKEPEGIKTSLAVIAILLLMLVAALIVVKVIS